MLELIKVQVGQGGLLKCSPNEFVLEVGCEVQKHPQLNNLFITQPFGDVVDQIIAPLFILFPFLTHPSLVDLKCFDERTRLQSNRWEEGVGDVALASSEVAPETCSLLHLEKVTANAPSEWFATRLLEDMLLGFLGLNRIGISGERHVLGTWRRRQHHRSRWVNHVHFPAELLKLCVDLIS